MSNPFDKFKVGEHPLEPTAAPAAAPVADPAAAAPVAADPNGDPSAVPVAVNPAVDASNPFNNPEPPASGPPKPMNTEDYQAAVYDYLNDPTKSLDPAAIAQWSADVAGRPMTGMPKGWKENIIEATRARKEGRVGVYGRMLPDKAADLANATIDADSLAAGFRGAMQPITFNFGDEADAALRAIPGIANGTYGERYRKGWEKDQLIQQIDQQFNPAAQKVGTAGGIAISSLAPVGAAARGASLANKAIRGAAAGGLIGGLDATGSGTPDDRFKDTGAGTAIGATVGALVPVAAEGVARAARPVVERLARGTTASASAFARRLGLNPEEIGNMRGRIANQADLVGDENVALIDVLPEEGRNVVGAAGKRDGAREQLQDVATSREVALPERVQGQADRISTDRRTPDQLRTGLEDYRDTDIQRTLDPIRATPLPVTHEVTQVLATREGQRAIRDAISMETDPAVRANLEALAGASRQVNHLDPRLPEATRNQIAAKIMEGVTFDINASDKISRALNRRGSQGGGRTLFDFGRTIRDAARAHPGYREAMEDYGTQSRSAEAVTTGEGVLSSNADDFEGAVGALPTEPTSRIARPPRVAEGRMIIPGEAPTGDASYVGPILNQIVDGGGSISEAVENVNITPEEIINYVRAGGRHEAQATEYLQSIGIDPTMWTGSSRSGAARSADAVAGAEAAAGVRGASSHELQYTLPSGEVIHGNIRTDGAGGPAEVEIYGIGNWNDVANKYGVGTMRDMAAEVHRLFPEVTHVQGARASGASMNAAADEKGADLVTQGQRIDNSVAAPPDAALARASAASTIRSAAGERNAAPTIARNIARSPEQQRRVTALVGPERAQRLGQAMDEEIRRVERVQQQTSRSGPNRNDSAPGIASGINVLYNPTSPVSWGRETIRFLHNIGMTPRDAQWIVEASTNPALRDQVIDQLERAGIKRDKAYRYVNLLRNSAVRASTAQEK